MKDTIRNICFIGFLWLVLILFFLIGTDGEILESEKRKAAPLPTLEDHTIEEMPDALTEYISDHFPWRHPILRFAAESSYNVFRSIRSDSAVIGKDGWMFLRDIQGTSPWKDFQGTNLYSEEELLRLEQSAQRLEESAQQAGCQVLLTVVPNKEWVYARYLPDDYLRFQDMTRRMQVVSCLQTKTELPCLDLTDALTGYAKTSDDLYLIADTHWTGQGAYLGADRILSSLGIPHTPYEKVTFSDGDRKECDIPNLCGLADYYADIHDRRADAPICAEPAEKSLCIIGDSFRYALMPYMEQSFQHVTAAGLMELSVQETPPDVLLVVVVERNLGQLSDVLEHAADCIEAG